MGFSKLPLCRFGPLALLLALSLGSLPAASQNSPGIPSPAELLGYDLGERFTDYGRIRGYVEALSLSSERVTLLPYGVTPEGRELLQLVIAAPEHQGRLPEILAANAELTLAETSAERARQIAATNPGIVYFSYGVHGNESSSSEAALWTAYDLAVGDPAVAGVLDSLIVVIDPVTNPDGRDRYVQWYQSVVGARPNADPQAREHREPWPGGRSNHYLFDLNRDWAWATQPETRARLATWFRWNPQVHVDFHEMSPNSSYFFFPASPPINPIYPKHILDWGIRFGRANASAFDARGWRYFTGESYDMLYPGYGDSWPSLHGAIGMTYEQAGGGAAGLRYAREDGDTLTLHARATQHRTTGAATLRAAAAEKTRLLLDFAEAHRTAGIGEPDILLIPGDDPARLNALLELLATQSIAVDRAENSFRARATPYPGFEQRTRFPEGTVLVRARQPRGRLAVTLLQPETELVGEGSYDITAWSLPYAYGVEAHQVDSPTNAAGWDLLTTVPQVAGDVPPAAYGYLVSSAAATARGVIDYMEEGGRVHVLGAPSTFAGREWPAGTWFLPSSGNPQVRDALEDAGLGGWAVPIAGGLSEQGSDLGSASTLAVRLPSIALIGGEGVEPSSYGAHWYHLEQELGIPFTALLLADLPDLALAGYDVIVLPNMRGALTDQQREVLSDWVQVGGRLIGVAGGAEAAAPLAEIELRDEPDADEEDRAAIRERFLSTREERERVAWEDATPGAILPVGLDPDHPLAWGVGINPDADRLFVLHTSDTAFEPREGAEAVARFDRDLEAISGRISEENLSLLEQSAWLITRVVGSGEVVLFADDPLFRHFWRSAHPLYRNAILFGAR